MNTNLRESIVLYTDKRGNVELRADVKKDTLWATQAQIGVLFEVAVPTVNEHLKNIFNTKELKEISTIRKFRIVQDENGRKVKRNMNFYNLDAMLAVGYRVNSKKATKFRIWATSILRQYLINGFNLNRRKLVASDETLDGLHEAVALLESKEYEGKVKGKLRLIVTKDLAPK